MVEYPIRREAEKYWSVTGEEGSVKFRRGMEALRAIRRAFRSDEEWNDPHRTGLKIKYMFQDSIENMLKNPGSNRDNPRYIVVKNALNDLAAESGEKADAIEEAALLVLGVLRRRRGSAAQISRMGERRLEQRREARGTIKTKWHEEEAKPRPSTPKPPKPPPIPPPVIPPPLVPPPPTSDETGGTSGDWFVLSVNVSPENGGRTTPQAGEVYRYKLGTNVTIQQKANKGFVFHHWELDGTKDLGSIDALTVTMNANHTVFAVYEGGEEEGKVYLTVESDPFEGVKVELDGLRMGVTTAYKQVDKNSMHTIKVPAEARDPNGNIYKFAAWENGSKPMPVRGIITRVVHVSEPMTVIARYEALILIVDSSPERGIPVKFGHRPPRPTDVTRIKEVVEKGKNYRVSVPSTHTSPDGTFYTFKKWEDESQQTERQVLMGDEPKTITAFYAEGGKVAHKRYGGVLSPYQGGVSPTGVGGAKDMTRSALAMSGVRGRISREVKTRELKKDPFILSIINKGKRILNSYAKAQYSKIFDPLKKEYKDRARELKVLQKAADRARAHLRKMIMKERRSIGYNRFKISTMKTHEDTMNLADQLASPGGTLAGNVTFNEARESLRRYLDARDKYYTDFKDSLEAASANLRDYLIGRAKTVTIGLTRRAKMPLNGEDEAAVLEALTGYAESLAQDFATRGRTMVHGFMRGLGMASRSLETGGAAITNVFVNLFTFITGPWTLTTLFALLEFFFVLTYVGYNIQILWIFPAIAAVFTFILNFSDSFQPLDWITHLSSGAIIGYSSALLLVALGAPGWGFIGGSNTIGFWIAWGILGFIGLFQFYQTGGFKVVLQVGVLVLLLSYLAMGPYQAYFHSAIGQVKAPVEIAYRSVSSAITDVWLLATNPTEWYARQQLVNVKAERPLDLPKGVEITSLEALPPSVPAGQQFALATVIRNDGILPASDIILSVGCNQWCNSLSAAPTTTKSYEDAKSRLGPGTVQSLDSGSIFYIDDKMERKEGQTITFTPLVAKVFAQSVAQTNIAKITFNLSYAYSTKSSLQVDVINENELERRFREGDTVFKPVVAVDKGTPARLSLNVGPQPLRANTNETILLISISNTRDNSKIVLPRGTNVTIKLPKAIGSGLECGPSQTKIEDDNYENVTYKIEPTSLTQDTIEVLPYDFNSIFAFICKFTTKDVDTLKSGFITAELPRYIFRIEQKKDVFITPTLGIIFEPYEAECNKCRDGIQACNDPNRCHALSDSRATGDPSRTCYFEYAGRTITQFSDKTCNVCGSTANNCEKFISQDSCEKEDSVCGWNCVWNEGKKHLVSGVEIGTCEKGEVPSLGVCKDLPPSFVTAYNTNYKDIIAGAIIRSGLGNYVQNPEALVAAVISQESGWNPNKVNPADPSYGIMQISTNAHPECDKAKITAFDATENIDCGVNFLARLASSHMNDPPKTYACKGVQYSGVDAILRYYNGWPSSGCSGDPDYVDRVKKYYTNWLACFQQTSSPTTPPASTTAAKGDPNYCEKKRAGQVPGVDAVACKEGEGGCKSDLECESIYSEPNPPQRLSCRAGVSTNIGVCCFPVDTQQQCLNKFNEWLGTSQTYGSFSASTSVTNYISQSNYNQIVNAAPARNSGTSVEYIVLHHSVESTIQDVLSKNLETRTNEHYIVDKDGTVVSVVPEQLSAQHANCLNSKSIGIEIINAGSGSDPYPEVQLSSLRTLVSDLINRYNIQQGRLIGHGCTSPYKNADEPTGLDPNFLPGWTVVKRGGSPVICSNLCA